MRVKRLNNFLQKYLKKKGLTKKFEKQVEFFISNPSHLSLNLELLEPKTAGRYSIRVDKKYRIIFIFTKSDEIEIIDINPHYK